MFPPIGYSTIQEDPAAGRLPVGIVRPSADENPQAGGKRLVDDLRLIAGDLLRGRADLLVHLLGWDGCGPRTLQTVGQNFGITRERVRQISQRAVVRIATESMGASSINEVRDRVFRNLPVSVETIRRDLVRCKLVDQAFDLSIIPELMRIFFRFEALEIREVCGVAVIGTPDHLRRVHKLFRAAEKSCSSWGLVSLNDLLSEDTGDDFPGREAARRLLVSRPDIRWLGSKVPELKYSDEVDADGSKGRRGGSEGDRLFTLISAQDNRIVFRLKKILCVAQSVRVDDVYEALVRDPRIGARSPTRESISALAGRLDFCRRIGGRIVRTVPLRESDLLSGAESLMVEVLRGRCGIGLHEFEAACLSAGMNRNTFRLYLSWSPIVARLFKGVYGLIGTSSSAKAVAKTRIIVRGRALQSWKRQGQLVDIVYKVTAASLINGVLSLPSALRDHLFGSYAWQRQGCDDGECIKVVGNCISGLRKTFKPLNLETGDQLILRFNLATRTVLVLRLDAAAA